MKIIFVYAFFYICFCYYFKIYFKKPDKIKIFQYLFNYLSKFQNLSKARHFSNLGFFMITIKHTANIKKQKQRNRKRNNFYCLMQINDINKIDFIKINSGIFLNRITNEKIKNDFIRYCSFYSTMTLKKQLILTKKTDFLDKIITIMIISVNKINK